MHKLKLSELNLRDAEVLTREQLKMMLGGGEVLGSGTFCGDRGTVSNCPADTTAEKCGSDGEAYCKDTSTGYCYAYGTAICTM